MSVKQYDIDWESIRTIKDLKKIVKILATRIVINHEDEDDQELYNELDKFLTETNFDINRVNLADDENQGDE